MLVGNLIERLRPLVGHESWDYIVLWKLSDDNRYIQLMDSICAGTAQNAEKNGEESFFPSSSCRPCRDILFSHSRTKACDLMDQVPSSITLGSGVHGEVLMSNQSLWLNFSYNTDSNPSEETIGTRVLVPVALGLLELFVTKQVPEDQGVLDYIKNQCNSFLEQHTNANGIHEIPTNSFSSEANFQNQSQIPNNPSLKNLDLPHEISIDRIHLGNNSPFNHFQQFSSTTSDIMDKNKSVFVEGTYLSDPFTPSGENGFHEMETAQSNMRVNASSSRMNEKMSFMEENNKSDESDQNEDDENDGKYRKRAGKGHQSKNLEAERKRRKKLNDRLYCLRALVPNISKLDRSAILGDAIDYVKELQKQVKDLQLELEEHSDDENARILRNDIDNCMASPLVTIHQNGTDRGPKREQENLRSGFHTGNGGIKPFKPNPEVESLNEKVQQMEPQVEVFQLEGNEFYVKVFCEHKPGGFLRLMEALDYLGLEVSNVNATRHTCLVSNIFKVEIKESESVQADYVKESLLELTRNPSRVWPNLSQQPSYNINNVENNRCQMNSHHNIYLPHN